MSRCIHEMEQDTCDLCRTPPHTPTEDTYCRQGCGHPLTNPISLAFGVGPKCFGNDTAAQRKLYAALDGVPEGHWGVSYGPVRQKVANNWVTAFRQLGDLEVHAYSQPDDSDRLKIYVRRRVTAGT